MEHAFKEQKSESLSDGVFQVAGEPAVVINGVPNLSADPVCPSRPDVRSDSESNVNHGFGEWLEGREVKKLFGKKYYSGIVTKFDQETNWYRVVYEDDDFEDLEWHELQDVIVPVDIAIPLKELSLKILKHKHSLSKTSESRAKSKGYHGQENNKLRVRVVSSDVGSKITDGNQTKRKRGRPKLPENMRKSRNLKKEKSRDSNVQHSSFGETNACENCNIESTAEELKSADGVCSKAELKNAA